MRNFWMILVFIFFGYAVEARQQFSLEDKIDSLKGIVSSAKNDSVSAEALLQLSEIYYKKGNYVLDRDFAFRALEMSKGKLEILEGRARNEVALSFLFESSLDSALHYFIIAYEHISKTSNYGGIVENYTGVGQVYFRMGSNEKALEYWENALAIHDKHQVGDVANTYGSLGNIYSIFGDQPKARENYDWFLTASQKEKGTVNMTSYYNSIGVTYFLENNFEKAIDHYTTALEISKKSQDKYGEIISLINIGEAYGYLGKFEKADWYLQEGIKEAEKIRSFETLMSAYMMQSDVSALKNDHRQSLVYFKRFTSLKDSLFNAERAAKIAELRIQFESEKKEKELVVKTSELAHEKNKSLVITLLMVLMFIIAAIIIFYYLKMKKIKDELNTLNSTKDRFFAIISHDLRGTISGFKDVGQMLLYYLQKGDTKHVESIAQNIDKNANHLNQLLDNLLNWSIQQLGKVPFNPKTLVLASEIKKVTELFDDIANTKKISLTENIDDDLKLLADENGIQLIMRNLVSNAIKFTKEGGEVQITAMKDNDEVILTVRDTGIGITQEKIDHLFEIQSLSSSEGTEGEKGTGLGLSLCKYYAEMHGGKIAVESGEETGTVFTVWLPNVA